jgi:tripartite-type tricarboxylate transporter receptor subunit TctC
LLSRTARLTCVLLSLNIGFSIGEVLAQADYPVRPVKLIVPVSAGGAPDVVARIVGEKLSAKWRQPVIVENRAGGGEKLGAEAVAKAQPDGYTLLVTPAGPLVTSRLLYAQLSYDPDAFAPVSILTTGHYILLASLNAPVSTLQDVVKYAKTNPGKLTYASPGAGTMPHLTGEMFKVITGIETTHVPYKGLAPALNDLVAGHVDIMFDNLGNSLGMIREGRVKAVGVVSEKPIPEIPDVPAIAQTYPEFLSQSWFGVVAPPGTSRFLTESISRTIAEVLGSPDVTKRLQALSFVVIGSSPDEMAAFMSREKERWGKVVAAAGIKPE